MTAAIIPMPGYHVACEACDRVWSIAEIIEGHCEACGGTRAVQRRTADKYRAKAERRA